MANLIITIIAIALVAVAALMGAYYGGTAFNQGQEKAKAASLMNQAAQIQAAVQMARVDYPGVALDQSDLDGSVVTTVDGGEVYLSTIPAVDGDAWTIAVDANGDTTATWTGTPVSDICDSLADSVNGGTALSAVTTPWTCVADAASSVTFSF